MYKYHEPCKSCRPVNPIYSDRHIAFLICVSNARVLTYPVKIDQSEGVPDPGTPKRSFVKEFVSPPVRLATARSCVVLRKVKSPRRKVGSPEFCFVFFFF